jgi:hypothetical protein
MTFNFVKDKTIPTIGPVLTALFNRCLPGPGGLAETKMLLLYVVRCDIDSSLRLRHLPPTANPPTVCAPPLIFIACAVDAQQDDAEHMQDQLRDVLGPLCETNGVVLHVIQDIFHIFSRLRETLAKNHSVRHILRRPEYRC